MGINYLKKKQIMCPLSKTEKMITLACRRTAQSSWNSEGSSSGFWRISQNVRLDETGSRLPEYHHILYAMFLLSFSSVLLL